MDPHEGSVITVTTPNGTTTQTLGGSLGPSGVPRNGKMEGSAPPPAPGNGPPPPSSSSSLSGSANGPGALMHDAPASARPGGGYAPGPSEYMDRAPLPPGVSRGGPPPPPPGLNAGNGSAYGPGPGAPPPPPPGAPMGYEPMGRGVPPPPPSGGAETAPRPPVEFNHAINYVNKIKQRFSGDPDTYKQFLEILQTYQKEQRPIHEVYAQVTVLFDHAKDLLEEFKQFLPDTGAPPGGGGGLFGMLGHVTNGMGPGGGPDGMPPGAAPPYEPGAGRLPPPPPHSSAVSSGSGSASRKKRMADEAQAEAMSMPLKMVGGSSASAGRKRSKKSDGPSGAMPPPPPGAPYMPMPGPGEAMGEAVYPPGAPMPPGYEPMPPEGYMPAGAMYGMQTYPPPHMMGGGDMMPMPPMATMDEVAFFERVKKHIDDRATYLDFLKLLNLYTQDAIDVATLVDRASLFLGGRPELLQAFKTLCGYDMGRHGWLEQDDPVLENVPALERERFDLSTQKSCGPSYRKLPASEVNLSCSGRDALCWEVLNDGWVSHPTWASEGESFNPHKKNVYEDALYRSEEERHEYDYHIEANLRTIALLEPIAARIAAMDNEERAAFRLKPGLGGQSKSIYQRIIKKVYGRDHGLEVIAALHDNPAVAVPVVLARLKQKDEEWKRAQREWNKVWREVDARNFYKALDHQGVSFKSTDKKAITPKVLVQEIETISSTQQQRRLTMDPSLPRLAPRFQLAYAMDDADVVADVWQLLAHYLERPSAALNQQERTRIRTTLQALLPRLWHISPETLATCFTPKARLDQSAEADEEADEATDGGAATSASPSASEEAETTASAAAKPASVDTWHIHTPTAPSSSSSSSSSSSTAMTSPSIHLFGNTTMYVFVRLLHLLYERLHRLKEASRQMADATDETWSKVNPLAAELGLMDTATGPGGLVSSIAAKLPGTLAASTSDDGSSDAIAEADQAVLRLHPSQFYPIALELIVRLLDNDVDQASFEEAIRFMFTREGYTIYTIDKVMQALFKTCLTMSADAKCQALLANFESTQQACDEMRTTSKEDGNVAMYKHVIASRMEAEHTVGRDEHLFRMETKPAPVAQGVLPPCELRIQLLSHDDMTLEDPQDAEQRWLQYIASYCLWAPTEGLSAKTSAPLLQRTLPASPETEVDPEGTRYLVKNGLDIRVCMKTYRLFFVQDTEDVFARIRPATATEAHRATAEKHAASRKQRWDEWLRIRHDVMTETQAAAQAATAPETSESATTQRVETSAPTEPSSMAQTTEPAADVSMTDVDEKATTAAPTNDTADTAATSAPAAEPTMATSHEEPPQALPATST